MRTVLALSLMLAVPGRDAPAGASRPAVSTPTLNCVAGPVQRTFGGTRWLVYGCDDAKSLVVVSARGNPAGPFYFLLTPKGSAYALAGEGQGDETASNAAGDALRRLSTQQIKALLVEALRAK